MDDIKNEMLLKNKKVIELQQHDPQLARKLITMYVASSNTQMNKIVENSATRDDKKIKEASHILKSISGNLGFEEVAVLCQVLENPTPWDQKTLDTLVKKLNEKLTEVTKSINSFLSKNENLPHTTAVNPA